ncbi:MAG: divergent PAP2 family protein [Clostridia bacterium]|nr:divergent PAP2 family protein [Clostridia bacterium]
MKIEFICFIAWMVAQILKLIFNAVKFALNKNENMPKLTPEILFKLGGMPSSHTATVIALAASIGLHCGWNSDIFAVSGVFSFIVMFDAINVRRPIGKLTDAFNSLRKAVLGKDTDEVKKVEGHTFPEVVGGFIVGVAVAYIMVRIVGFLD